MLQWACLCFLVIALYLFYSIYTYCIARNFGEHKIWRISPQKELASFKFGGMTNPSIPCIRNVRFCQNKIWRILNLAILRKITNHQIKNLTKVSRYTVLYGIACIYIVSCAWTVSMFIRGLLFVLLQCI